MKIIAYLCTDYIYFSKLLPEVGKYADVTPVVLCELLYKLGAQATPDGLAGIWDYLMRQEKYDALWCYGLPDEVTIFKCREHGIPILMQEYWGHYPHNLTGVLPHDCDWETYYAPQTALLPEIPGRKNDKPLITICMSDGLYDRSLTLGEVMKSYQPGGRSPRNPFWFPNRLFDSYASLAALVIDSCRNDERLADCPVRVRLHPRYPDLFKETADYVMSLGDARYTVDQSPVGDSLAETDIIVQVNSNYGFDGIRSGAEVISVGGLAFYDNPQLTTAVMTGEAFRAALKAKAELIRGRGRQVRNFVPLMLRDLETVFHHPCLEPYPAGTIADVLKYTAALPQLRWS